MNGRGSTHNYTYGHDLSHSDALPISCEVQVEAVEEGGGVGEGKVAQAQYCAPCAFPVEGARPCSLPFKGVRAIRLRGTAARVDRTPGALRRAGRAGVGMGFGWVHAQVHCN